MTVDTLLAYGILLLLIGLCPDEATSNTFRPHPSGDGSFQSRQSFRRVGDLGCSMKEYPLTNSSLKLLVDDEDYPIVTRYKTWQLKVSRDGRVKGVEHCTYGGSTNKRAKTLRLSRLIMGAAKGVLIDHKDGNTLDNRKGNLRVADYSTNGQNRKKQRKPTSSRYKGVTFSKRDSGWYAYIYVRRNGVTRHKHLGIFKSETEAAEAYNSAAQIYFGQFAIPNPI